VSLLDAIAHAISANRGKAFAPENRRVLSGGCINTTVMLEGSGQSYFVKLNDVARVDMFVAESEGLSEIADSKSVRVPQSICAGTHAGQAYLVLEYLDIGRATGTSDELLGRQLAAMHRTSNLRFGWRRSNTIGSTPQINTPEDDWITFYREHRLRFQLELAAKNGYGDSLQRRGELLLGKLAGFFISYQPQPSLLHGDLWGGNHAALRDGTPVIFDPAVYYGDRETDLAMTELFGGFGPRFYAAYREAWPLDPGYPVRRDLYNLYHVLNHLNLFGGGYRGQAMQLIELLLSQNG
jgi:protein-ribulosamine 3-kinase